MRRSKSISLHRDIDPTGTMKLLLITLLVAYAAADVSHIVKPDEAAASIIQQDLDVGVNGQFQWSYETANGISAREEGAQSENAGEIVQGGASWTAPNGELVQFTYIADENGYQPQGSHIPTPPPIPQQIAKGLEYIRSHPPPPESP